MGGDFVLLLFLQRYLRNLFRVMLSSSSSPLRADADGGFHLTKHDICEFSPFFKKGVFEYSSHGTGWLDREASEISSKPKQKTARCLFSGPRLGRIASEDQRRKNLQVSFLCDLRSPVRCSSALSPCGNFIMNVKVGNAALCLKSFFSISYIQRKI